MLTCSGVSGDCGAASIESKRVDTTSKKSHAPSWHWEEPAERCAKEAEKRNFVKLRGLSFG